jgi:hypothetical protein
MKKCFCLSVSLLALFLFSFSTAGFSQSAASSRDLSFTIPTSQAWTDTGTDLQAGDVLEISAMPAEGSSCDPNGVASAAKGGNLPVADANPGAVIVRLQAQGNAIEVGASKQVHADAPGHLFLGVNTAGSPPCAGSIAIKVHITFGAPAANAATPEMAKNVTSSGNAPSTPSGTAANGSAADIKQKLASAAQVWLQGQFGNEKAGTPTSTGSTSTTSTSSNSAVNGTAATSAPATLELSKDKLDSTLTKAIDGLPRRVNDEFDNLGDMVNFVIIGSQKGMQDSLDAANWHVADTNNTESALKAVLQTYEKKDYLTMPMSQLRLFGRVQDYGYEQAEPYAVVASRHHFRIWKAPFTYNGQTVWVGAGTHDIGFEKDQRNGKVTHKIDPNVDGERENIASSLQKAGKVKSLHYYLPPNPVQDARNATGGGYRSDGRIIVILLK